MYSIYLIYNHFLIFTFCYTISMIALTDKATTKVAQLLTEEEAGLFLRVGVRAGGCAGFSYEMFFDSELDDSDVQQTYGSVKVVADSASAGLLDGANLDYHDGLGESGFKITNQKAQKSCGCGQSFC